MSTEPDGSMISGARGIEDGQENPAPATTGLAGSTTRAAADPESWCHRCGGPNRSWHVPSPLWNAVMRGGSINGEEEYSGIVCPTCFMVLAEERGVGEAWRLDARVVHVELELTTPSGRVWDAEADLWREPA